jgi:hypothetical protein
VLATVGMFAAEQRPVLATPLEIEIRARSQSRFANEFANAMRLRIQAQSEKYLLVDPNRNTRYSAAVVVTVGMDAFRDALSERPRRRILATAIPRPAFVSLLEREGLTPETAPDVTGIFVGQSVRHNLALLRAIFPNAKNLCAFDTKNIPFRAPAAEASRKFGFTTLAIAVDSPLDVLPKLEANISRCELLWITHDTSAVTSENIRALLLISLRNGVPVMGGVIPDFVDQGALATISSTSEQNEDEALSRLENFRKHRMLGPSAYANEWKIWVNRKVVSTLKMEVPDETVLSERIVKLLAER